MNNEAREVLEDVVSHYSAISDAINRCYKKATGDDISYWNHELAAFARMFLKANGALEALAQVKEVPIDMVLHCPKCGLQHIDAPGLHSEFDHDHQWTNPPHRSHLCHGCGHIWRPADVPTNGVAAVKTKGKDDSPPADIRFTLLLALNVLRENNRWHIDHDDHDGYDDSELQSSNLAAMHALETLKLER